MQRKGKNMSTIFTKMMTKEEVDKHNQISIVNDEQKDYICTMCRDYCSLSESYSSRGKNLLCISCFNTMCDILNIKPLQLMDIIHSPSRIVRRAELEALSIHLRNIENIFDLTKDDNITNHTIYTKYWNGYKAIVKFRKDIEKQFDLKYEQNMNKNSIDTGYQE